MREIADTGRDVSPVVLSASPKTTGGKYGCKAINRFNIFRLLTELIHCDVLLSGGGSLLQDKTSTRSLLYYLFIIRTAELFGKKVYLYANGIGPVATGKNRKRVSKAVSGADAVTVRDLDSKEELSSMGVGRDDIVVTSDPVFTLRGVQRDSALELLQSLGIDTQTQFIAVSVRKLPESPESNEFLTSFAQLLDNIHERYNCNILFIVMQPGTDTIAAVETANLMTTPSITLDSRQSAEQLIGIIGASQLMIAMRLHALIFAARAGITLTGIEYDPKVDAFLKTTEMPSLGTPQDFDGENALQIIDDLMEHRAENAHAIGKKANELEALSKLNTQLLVELLD
jgi:polysaccharide pyruvyl transferase CsaB